MSRKRKEKIEESTEAPETATDTQAAGPGETAPVDEVRELGLALEEARAEARRNYDLYLRAAAELENYRKRAQREREDLAKFANEKILREMLPVIDNLERAVEHARQDGDKGGSLLEGVEMTLTQFGKVLEKFNVVSVTSVGEPFDPARHEAMGQIESAEHPPNTVAQELQKGYLLHERLLRPSLVMVTRAPAAPAKDAATE